MMTQNYLFFSKIRSILVCVFPILFLVTLIFNTSTATADPCPPKDFTQLQDSIADCMAYFSAKRTEGNIPFKEIEPLIQMCDQIQLSSKPSQRKLEIDSLIPFLMTLGQFEEGLCYHKMKSVFKKYRPEFLVQLKKSKLTLQQQKVFKSEIDQVLNPPSPNDQWVQDTPPTSP